MFHIEVFQDCEVDVVTLLPVAYTPGEKPYMKQHIGEPVTLPLDEFRRRGLEVVQEMISPVRADPDIALQWSSNCKQKMEIYLRKPRMIFIEPSADGPEARIRIGNWDNTGDRTPCWYDEETTIVPLREPEVTPAVLLDWLSRSRDSCYDRYSIWTPASFTCVYRDDRTGLYHWFDWVKIRLPDGLDELTAWGHPRVFDRDALRAACRGLAITTFREFEHRDARNNPNPHPRGSQVEDAGVADQRLVVICQRDDPSVARFEVYNLDSADRSQTETDVVDVVPLDTPDAIFGDRLLQAFDRCEVE